MKKVLFFIVFLAICLFIFYFSCYVEHESTSFEQISFTIDKKYLTVVQSISKKDSLEDIVKQNNANLIEKKWEKFEINTPERVLRIREYKISGNLDFTVEKTDKFLGNLKIPLKQTINFDKNMLKIDINLQKNHEKINFYEKNIEITPFLGENKTFVEIKSKLCVKNKIPFFFKEFMDKKVSENNKKDIENLENNIKNTINNSKLTINTFKTKFELF